MAENGLDKMAGTVNVLPQVNVFQGESPRGKLGQKATGAHSDIPCSTGTGQVTATMIRGERIHNDLPLMADEEIELSFGERHGLEADATTDRNTLVLTKRRLIRLSKNGVSRDMAFISLRDIQVAEVRRTSRGKRPLLRIALLMAGAGSALATISFLPLSIPLATVLALAGSYHLLRYLNVSQEGSILFHAGQEEVGISFEGDVANQAYTFVNRFFNLKEAFSPTPEASEERQPEPDTSLLETPIEEPVQGTNEVEMETVISQDDEGLVKPHDEEIPQDEPSESQAEEDETRRQS
jgi:hypothetical protein